MSEPVLVERFDNFPAEFWQGIEQFNQGQFYDCHDTLEAIWIEAPEEDKKFYQGILQVAVALYHLGNQNLRGAVILLGEGSQRLRAYPIESAPIDLPSFLTQVQDLLTTLQMHPADTPVAFPASPPKIHRL